MPKSIWNGTITFGQVNVPVKLYSATESKSVHFHELHQKDGARIEHRRFCSKEGNEVPYREVVKGYEVSDYRLLLDARPLRVPQPGAPGRSTSSYPVSWRRSCPRPLTSNRRARS